MFSICLRFNPLPRHLIFFGSILLFCGSYYFDGHSSTLEVLNASENYMKNGLNVQHYKSTTKTTAAKDSSTSSFKSTCSVEADRRGLNQNVISYSIYGKNFSDHKFYNLYLKSFTETLRTIPIKYPGWVVRIYHDLTSDNVEHWRILNNVLDLGTNMKRDHIDLCNATQIIKNRKLGNIFEMTWRWLPLLDFMVDTMMSRDSDSAIIAREQDAVAEWLASNKTFHLMRDHPLHYSFFVGCCWGVKINQKRSEILATAKKMFQQNHLHQKGYDQELLNSFYQSMALESMVAHDSYCCEYFLGSQPFPTPRQNKWFVGAPQHNPMQTINVPCPESCRPHNLVGALALADWSFC